MKILKTEDIKTKIVEWLKTVYDGYEIDGGYYYTSIRLKDVGGVDIHFLKRRNIRVRGSTNTFQVGGGVSFGRRDGSMLIRGGAKSDFGIFDEVELKRRIDHRFKQKIDQKEETKKAEQVYKDKIVEIEPKLISYGFVPDTNRYSWQKTWEYDRKIRVSLRNGGSLQIDLLHNDKLKEEEILKLAKGIKELLSGELTSNTI